MNPDEFKTKWRSHFHDFYEEYKNHEAIFENNQSLARVQTGMMDYAKLGIKNLTIINGGAIIALPAIAEAFNLSINEFILYSAYSYSGGLTSILICVLFAYFSLAQGTQSLFYDRNKDYLHFMTVHMREIYDSDIIKSMEKDKDKQEKESAKHNKRAYIYEYIAIFLAILSLGFFISGSLFFLHSMQILSS